METAEWTAADGWLAPQYLSGPDEHGATPRVVVAPDGEATATWRRFIESSSYLWSASRPGAGEDWSAADWVPESLDVQSPELAIDGQGEAMAIWVSRFEFGAFLNVSRRPPGGPWSAIPDEVPTSGVWPSRPQIALDAGGDATIAWQLDDGDNPVVEALVQRNGFWGSPVRLSVPDHRGLDPSVAVDPTGSVPTAAWVGRTGVEASAYDSAAPALRDLSIPSSAIAGTPVAFSVSPFDVLSPITLTTWRIGGESYVGERVTHTFPVVPGRVNSLSSAAGVRVTSRDLANNSTSATASVRVVQPSQSPRVPTSGGPGLTLVAPPQSLARVVRTGRLRAVCRLGAPATCRVRADLEPALAKRMRIPGRRVARRIVIARGHTIASQGGPARVALELTPRARKALRRIHRARTAARRHAIARAPTSRAKRIARNKPRAAIPIRLHATARLYTNTRTAIRGSRLR